MRLLAVIQLKNGIDKQWRVLGQPKAVIKDDEKNSIRQNLFRGTTHEPDKTLSLHNALVVAKVVRLDYPAHWPDAVPSIIEMLRSYKDSDQARLSGALQIMLHVAKELGTARLKRSQDALQRITPKILYVVFEIYSAKSSRWTNFLSSGQGSQTEASVDMGNTLCCLKLLRRLVVTGYNAPEDDKTVREFWASSQSQFGQLLALTNQGSALAQYHDIIGKQLLQLAKLHVNMAQAHPVSFTTLPNSLSLVRAYWDLVSKFADVFNESDGIRQGSTDSGTAKAKAEGPLPERLALRGLLLLRACVKIAFQPVQTFKYRSPETKARQEQVMVTIKNELLKPDFVIQMVDCIITHLFAFRRADLEAWEEDPEDWEHLEQSEGNAFEWEVRPCAEKLFLDLLTNFKLLLIPPLLSYFQTAQDSKATITTKEAVYTAMGLAAAHVVGVFDFEAVLASTILYDAQQQGRLYKVLRRRIAILISQWAPVQMTRASRPLVYQIFHHFLNPNDQTNDSVVRITAARQLRWLVDELGFQIEAFLPYTADILTQLIQLIQTIDVDETKLAILESIRILVMRMEDHAAQFGDQLMSALPAVWQSCGAEEYLIKQGVIAILAALTMTMGSNAQRYHGFMVPLLSEAARPESDLHLPLIDESLELWDAILTQSNAPLRPEITDLASLALPLLEYQSETASQALTVVESYMLMAPEAMLEDKVRGAVLSALLDTLDSRSVHRKKTAIICLQLLVRAAGELGGTGGVSVLIQDMISTGFLNKMLTKIQDAWEAHQTTGPNKKSSPIDDLTEGGYFCVLARLALAEPSLFVQMLSTFGNLEQVWVWLSSEWLSLLFGVEKLEQQKLYLLGLTRLLELPSPMHELVLGKLQDYFAMWTTIVAELHDGESDGGDTLLARPGEEVYQETARDVRETQVRDKDPVHTLRVFPFVAPRLQGLAARVGGERAFEEQWAVNVDKDVLKRFQAIASAPRYQ